MKAEYMWLRVTHDEYELPTAVGSTAKELAEICGVARSTVLKSAHRRKDGTKSIYVKVKMDEES